MEIKIKVFASIGRGKMEDEINIEIEDDMDQEEIEREANEAAKTWAENFFEWGFEIIE